MSYLRFSVIIVLLIVGTVFAQEVTPEATEKAPTDIVFSTFTLSEPEISGIAPADWDEVLPGSYLNLEDESNSTYILHFATSEMSLNEQLEPILASFLQEALPDESEDYESEDYTWNIYTFEYMPSEESEPLVVDIATAERGVLALVVVLQSTPENYEHLHDRLFLPSIDYFGQPLDMIQANLELDRLTPETIEAFGIDTVIPVGWENANPGSYVRGDLQVDPTTLLIQTSPDLSEDEFRDLFLERLNIADAGDGESYDSDTLEWTIYTIDIEIEESLLTWQIATASDANFAYLVVVFSFTDERDTLRESVLLPVLDDTRQSE